MVNSDYSEVFDVNLASDEFYRHLTQLHRFRKEEAFFGEEALNNFKSVDPAKEFQEERPNHYCINHVAKSVADVQVKNAFTVIF